MYISNCCGAPPKGNGDSDSSDIGICPECGNHCDYEDMPEELDDVISKSNESILDISLLIVTEVSDEEDKAKLIRSLCFSTIMRFNKWLIDKGWEPHIDGRWGRGEEELSIIQLLIRYEQQRNILRAS